MQQEISEWVNFLSVSKSPYTVYSYSKHLNRLAAVAPDRKASEWTRGQLLEYVAGKRLVDKNGDAAIKQIVGAIKNFFTFACGDNSPAKALPYPKVKRRKQRVLDRESASNLLASFDTSTAKGTRDLAIVTLMIDTGLRSVEVCRLCLDKLDMKRRRLYVTIKGGEEGRAIFSQSTADILDRWLSIRSTHADENCFTLFCGIGGNKHGHSMTTGGLRSVFRNIAKQHGLPHFSPHDLRRTFATIAIRNGAPTRIVQKAGRWEDLMQVERYTEEITVEDFERYSPIESLFEDKDNSH